MMARENVSGNLSDSLTEDPNCINNDRELIADFLEHVQDVQHDLG